MTGKVFLLSAENRKKKKKRSLEKEKKWQKRKSWELARLCKDFICKNSTKWVEDKERRVHQQKLEDEKKEKEKRLDIIQVKRKEMKRKDTQKKITECLEILKNGNNISAEIEKEKKD